MTTTYRPSANAANARTLADAGTQMTIDGDFVSAEVTETGEYTVFVGLAIVATGQLDGTEGNLNIFFAAEALAAAANNVEDSVAAASPIGLEGVHAVSYLEALTTGGFTYRKGYTHELANETNDAVAAMTKLMLTKGCEIRIQANHLDANSWLVTIGSKGSSYATYTRTN